MDGIASQRVPPSRWLAVTLLCVLSIYVAATGCRRDTSAGEGQRRDTKVDAQPAPDPAAQVVTTLPAIVKAGTTAAPLCQAPAGRAAEELAGRVDAGKAFSARTASGWILRLVPVTHGWFLQIAAERQAKQDLARLTPPFHFVPNPREIEGWHFRNVDNTGPNDGSVNAPGALREFIFSPRAGQDPASQGAAPGPDDVDQARAFGRGWLYVENYELTPPQAGQRASFRWLQFTACLTWPAAAVPPRLDSEDEAVARVKHLDVHELDPALGNAEFRYWFSTTIAAPRSDVSYEMNDCGEQTGGPADAGRDIPLCVEVRALSRKGTVVSLSILVGSIARGVLSGKPGLWAAYEEGTNGPTFLSVRSLGDLVNALK